MKDIAIEVRKDSGKMACRTANIQITGNDEQFSLHSIQPCFARFWPMFLQVFGGVRRDTH
ncbi:MAG: hypothetical protein COA65_07995 [Rhodospirillaceae bacterium]|nr:MAG: hypothetical protein COA65_07995 [Rhodospirillaceae bacterium]